MIDDCFENFVIRVVVVVNEGDELDWIFFNSLVFIFVFFIIIGNVL